MNWLPLFFFLYKGCYFYEDLSCEHTYIIFSDRSKLASSDSETAPTLQKQRKASQGKKNTNESAAQPKDIFTLAYWINRRHGVVDEVILFLLWSHRVAKANIPILLIPTVTPSAEEAEKGTFIFRQWQTEECIIKEIYLWYELTSSLNQSSKALSLDFAVFCPGPPELQDRNINSLL